MKTQNFHFFTIIKLFKSRDSFCIKFLTSNNVKAIEVLIKESDILYLNQFLKTLGYFELLISSFSCFSYLQSGHATPKAP